MNQINCPFCKAKVIEQPDWVVNWYDPRFTCKKCKQSGTLSWSAGDSESATRIVKPRKDKVSVIKAKTVRRK